MKDVVKKFIVLQIQTAPSRLQPACARCFLATMILQSAPSGIRAHAQHLSCLVLRNTRYDLQVEYVNKGGADCYSQYGASWKLAASSRLAVDGRRDEEGGGRSLLLNWSMVSELTVSGCSKFHSGIVLGKKECLYGSVEVRIVLYLNWWDDLVLESALSNKSWWGTDMISWMIFKSRARRICFRLSFNCCQPRSDNIWVTLLRGPKSWHKTSCASLYALKFINIIFMMWVPCPRGILQFWSY